MAPDLEPKLESNLISESPAETRDRNWMPMAIAAAVGVVLVVAVLLMGGHSRRGQEAVSSSTSDPYAANLNFSNLAMSESTNLVGGKITYVNGRVANRGDRTVTGALVLVIFRDYKNEVAQSQRLPLTVIRMREPYIDTVTLAAAPLQPGAQQDFRLNFDSVTPDWGGALPELHIVHVDLK
jgi:hypothetical protein